MTKKHSRKKQNFSRSADSSLYFLVDFRLIFEIQKTAISGNKNVGLGAQPVEFGEKIQAHLFYFIYRKRIIILEMFHRHFNVFKCLQISLYVKKCSKSVILNHPLQSFLYPNLPKLAHTYLNVSECDIQNVPKQSKMSPASIQPLMSLNLPKQH